MHMFFSMAVAPQNDLCPGIEIFSSCDTTCTLVSGSRSTVSISGPRLSGSSFSAAGSAYIDTCDRSSAAAASAPSTPPLGGNAVADGAAAGVEPAAVAGSEVADAPAAMGPPVSAASSGGCQCARQAASPSRTLPVHAANACSRASGYELSSEA